MLLWEGPTLDTAPDPADRAASRLPILRVPCQAWRGPMRRRPMGLRRRPRRELGFERANDV